MAVIRYAVVLLMHLIMLGLYQIAVEFMNKDPATQDILLTPASAVHA